MDRIRSWSKTIKFMCLRMEQHFPVNTYSHSNLHFPKIAPQLLTGVVRWMLLQMSITRSQPHFSLLQKLRSSQWALNKHWWWDKDLLMIEWTLNRRELMEWLIAAQLKDHVFWVLSLSDLSIKKEMHWTSCWGSIILPVGFPVSKSTWNSRFMFILRVQAYFGVSQLTSTTQSRLLPLMELELTNQLVAWQELTLFE